MIGPSFRAVLAAARSRDEHAFAHPWRGLQPRLLRYLQVVEPSAAEDVAAESWLEVIRTLDASMATSSSPGPGFPRSAGSGSSTGVVELPARRSIWSLRVVLRLPGPDDPAAAIVETSRVRQLSP
jgi:hypothetical protein